MEHGWLFENFALAASLTISIIAASRAKSLKKTTVALADPPTERPLSPAQESSGASGSTSTTGSATTRTSASASDSPLALKTAKEKSKTEKKAESGIFRKLRRKYLRNRKVLGDDQEKTEFEKVAVRRRPARSKMRNKNALKWKEGVVPEKSSFDAGKEKKKYRSKKRKRKRRKMKLKDATGTTTSSDQPEPSSEEQKAAKAETGALPSSAAESESGADDGETEETEFGKDDSEYESKCESVTECEASESVTKIDTKKTETTPDSSSSSSTPQLLGSPSGTPLPSGTAEFSLVDQAGGAKQSSLEYLTPLIIPGGTEKPLIVVAAASSSTDSSSSTGSPSSTTTTPTGFITDDDEPIILSVPACEVLQIIIKKDLFKNAAATERENEIIRLYFAGKLPPGRQRNAEEALERAVDLAVTRVKAGGLTSDLYQFLESNRTMAISFMIDAMKFKKKDFLPEFWDYDRMPKKK